MLPCTHDSLAGKCPRDSRFGISNGVKTQSGVGGIYPDMIRKLKSGEFRLYSRKKDASTGKRRNLGTFSSLEKAKQHEREVQYFKKH